MTNIPYRGGTEINRGERPRLVGTSNPSTACNDGSARDLSLSPPRRDIVAIFKNAKWSPDGTTILTSSEDRILRSFILPTDLLTSSYQRTLNPYSFHETPSPLYATDIHPSFTLSAPSTTLYVASCASMPVRLLSPFSPSLVASYPLIHSSTETYVAPHSLLFSNTEQNRFLAGADSLIAQFDLSRPSSSPVNVLPTIPSKRKTLVGGGVGMKGIVSAMALSCDGILAAGTFTGWLGLYDGDGVGDTLAVFPLRASASSHKQIGMGQGVTSLAWTSCGRYLVVAERGSDGMGVWDVRGSGKRLAWLLGRKAQTMQRLSIAITGAVPGLGNKDIVRADEVREGLSEDILNIGSHSNGHESVLAGGTDGKIRMWPGIGKGEGLVTPTWSFSAHMEAVGAVDIHPYAGVMATCSGAREWNARGSDGGATLESARSRRGSEESGESVEGEQVKLANEDRSLRIWSL